ncbi:MAG TPA: hypothetical protein VIQ30_25670 [Pseudonocardia sp.]|jgi:hypothetical protein
MRNAAKLIAAIAAVFHLGVGLWAFAVPLSFFTYVASFPPYNEHLIHDIGAFNLGLCAAAVGGILITDSLVAVLTGLAVGAVMHEIAHICDRLLGGNPSDPYTLGGFAVIVLIGLLAAARSLDRRRSPADVS